MFMCDTAHHSDRSYIMSIMIVVMRVCTSFVSLLSSIIIIDIIIIPVAEAGKNIHSSSREVTNTYNVMMNMHGGRIYE